jgi:hypothetical protein
MERAFLKSAVDYSFFIFYLERSKDTLAIAFSDKSICSLI